MPYNLTAEGPEQNRGYAPPLYPGLTGAPTVAPAGTATTPAAAAPTSPFTYTPNTGSLNVSPGGGASVYRAPTVDDVQQRQLLALKMGLDLAGLQQFGLNQTQFMLEYGKYQDPKTGVFKIPGVTPGALATNGASVPITGPGGYVLAAGSTREKPIDLATIRSSSNNPALNAKATGEMPTANMPGTGGTGLAGPNPNAVGDAASLAATQQAWENDPAVLAARARYSSGGTTGQTDAQALANWTADHPKSSNFLPPYLQPKQGNDVNGLPQTTTNQPPTATPVPQTETANPLAPTVPQSVTSVTPPGSPLTPFVPPNTAKATKVGSFAQAAKILQLPFYMRNKYANR